MLRRLWHSKQENSQVFVLLKPSCELENGTRSPNQEMPLFMFLSNQETHYLPWLHTKVLWLHTKVKNSIISWYSDIQSKRTVKSLFYSNPPVNLKMGHGHRTKKCHCSCFCQIRKHIISLDYTPKFFDYTPKSKIALYHDMHDLYFLTILQSLQYAIRR